MDTGRSDVSPSPSLSLGPSRPMQPGQEPFGPNPAKPRRGGNLDISEACPTPPCLCPSPTLSSIWVPRPGSDPSFPLCILLIAVSGCHAPHQVAQLKPGTTPILCFLSQPILHPGARPNCSPRPGHDGLPVPLNRTPKGSFLAQGLVTVGTHSAHPGKARVHGLGGKGGGAW